MSPRKDLSDTQILTAIYENVIETNDKLNSIHVEFVQHISDKSIHSAHEICEKLKTHLIEAHDDKILGIKAKIAYVVVVFGALLTFIISKFSK
jgi:hypothetical protein